jgi:hypothetical protein
MITEPSIRIRRLKMPQLEMGDGVDAVVLAPFGAWREIQHGVFYLYWWSSMYGLVNHSVKLVCTPMATFTPLDDLDGFGSNDLLNEEEFSLVLAPTDDTARKYRRIGMLVHTFRCGRSKPWLYQASPDQRLESCFEPGTGTYKLITIII